MDEETRLQQLILDDPEEPPASWKHILAVTVFFSIFLCVLPGFLHYDAWGSILPRLLGILRAGLPALGMGAALGGFLRFRANHANTLQERLLEDMDRDDLQGGPWVAEDRFVTRYSLIRAPIRLEPPDFLRQPDSLWKQSSPEVQEWVRQNRHLLESATDFERQALAFCAQEGTPAGIGSRVHGETSLFLHSAEVWKRSAESFGPGSDAALLSVAHDLGKVLAFRKSGESWTRKTNRHERLSVIAALHLDGFLLLDEDTRRRFMQQLIGYTNRKKSPAPAPAGKAIQQTVRSDVQATLAEAAAQPGTRIIPLPTLEPAQDALGEAQSGGDGPAGPAGGACVIPLSSSPQAEPREPDWEMEEGEEEDPALQSRLHANDQEISRNIQLALSALNINGRSRASAQAQAIYCPDTGFFVHTFSLTGQLCKMGLAAPVDHASRGKSPWDVEASRAVLMTLSRSGWIITSPGRFTSEQGNDGVFDLRSGRRKYRGMVSIDPNLLDAEFLSSIGEWCFDMDPA